MELLKKIIEFISSAGILSLILVFFFNKVYEYNKKIKNFKYVEKEFFESVKVIKNYKRSDSIEEIIKKGFNNLNYSGFTTGGENINFLFINKENIINNFKKKNHLKTILDFYYHFENFKKTVEELDVFCKFIIISNIEKKQLDSNLIKNSLNSMKTMNEVFAKLVEENIKELSNLKK